MTGIVVVAAVLVLAAAFGLWRRSRDGAVRDAVPRPEAVMLTSDDLGHQLGSRATLVQFSTAFCQPCRATRATLAHVAGSADGVVHVEIDAESHLDLVRRLGVVRTPTTFVLDSTGEVVRRATGAPRAAEVHAALPSP